MANRAYLYAEIDIGAPQSPSYHDISEWSNEIPLAYKILLSGRPTVVDSILFDGKGMAILSDYDSGVDRLKKMLREAGFMPDHKELIEIEKGLVSKMGNGFRFRLEPLEIFALSIRDPKAQINDLISSIKNVENEISEFIRATQIDIQRPSLFRRLLGLGVQGDYKNKDDILYSKGFGFWCDVLFYSLENQTVSAIEKQNEEKAQAKRDYWRSKL
jgi:hypothetical protein